GAAFTLQQNRRATGRDLSHNIKDLEHGLAFAHDIFEVVATLECALELDIFFFGAAAGDCGANISQQFFVVPGFLEEIRGTGLHGADGIFNRAVSGNHDDRYLGVKRTDVGKDLKTAASGKRKVEQYQIERTFSQPGQAVFTVDSGLNPVAFNFEESLKRLAYFSFVVNDEHAALRRQSDIVHPARNDSCFRH